MEGKWQTLLALAIVCCVLNNVKSVTIEEHFKPDLFISRSHHYSEDSDSKTIKLKKYGSGYEIKEVTKAKLNNMTKIKYTEVYKGIHVFGCSVVLELGADGCFTDYAVGRLCRNIEQDVPSVTPKISASMAMHIAKSYENEIKGKAVRTSPKPKHNINTDKPKAADSSFRQGEKLDLQPMLKPSTEIIIYIDSKKKKAVLVYHIEYLLSDEGFFGTPSYFIDAITGKMIKYWNNSPSQMSARGGNIKIGQYEYGRGRWAARNLVVQRIGSFWHPFCVMRNNLAQLFHCNHRTLQFCFLYASLCAAGPTDGDNGAYSQAADAFWFTTAVEEMYEVWYNDHTMFNVYGRVDVAVHVNLDWPDQPSWANAGWAGFPNLRYGIAVYGDGNTNDFLPFTSAGVVAHEMAHGFTQARSGLNPTTGQAAGMNEAFSDMAAVTFKNYLSGSNDWNIMYDIMRREDAHRYMKFPPKDGNSIQCACDYNNQDEHFTSGVYNKAFYILANKPAWCVRTAFDVFLRANMFFWAPESSYNDGACGVIEAAKWLGHNPADVRDVEDAFAQVGVFCACPPDFEKRNDCSCYKFVKDQTSWMDSKEFCESIGAALVSIEDKDEQEWIEKYIDNNSNDFYKNKQFWIGGIDVAEEGTWIWVSTESPVVYAKWHPNDPINVNKVEHCMGMDYKDGSYGWYDQDCYRKQMYICEKTCTV